MNFYWLTDAIDLRKMRNTHENQNDPENASLTDNIWPPEPTTNYLPPDPKLNPRRNLVFRLAAGVVGGLVLYGLTWFVAIFIQWENQGVFTGHTGCERAIWLSSAFGSNVGPFILFTVLRQRMFYFSRGLLCGSVLFTAFLTVHTLVVWYF